MKKAANFLKLFMWASIGGLVGVAERLYIEDSKSPYIKTILGAPWYIRLLPKFYTTLCIVGVVITIRIILWRYRKKHPSNDSENPDKENRKQESKE